MCHSRTMPLSSTTAGCAAPACAREVEGAQGGRGSGELHCGPGLESRCGRVVVGASRADTCAAGTPPRRPGPLFPSSSERHSSCRRISNPAANAATAACLQQAKVGGDEGILGGEVQLRQRRPRPPLLRRGAECDGVGAGQGQRQTSWRAALGKRARRHAACTPAALQRAKLHAAAMPLTPKRSPSPHLQPVGRQRPRGKPRAVPALRVGALGLQQGAGVCRSGALSCKQAQRRRRRRQQQRQEQQEQEQQQATWLNTYAGGGTFAWALLQARGRPLQ